MCALWGENMSGEQTAVADGSRSSSRNDIIARTLDVGQYDHPISGLIHNDAEQDCLSINICGRHFELPKELLKQYPETLLGDPIKLNGYYNPRRGEYFFNRNQECFECVLEYYQTGLLRKPIDVTLDRFIPEVAFFQLGNSALLQLVRDEGYEVKSPPPLPENRFLRTVWLLVDRPKSSFPAAIFGVLSITAIVISIVQLIAETIPEAQTECGQKRLNHSFYEDPFFIVESVCIAWFALEFLLRLISCPSKKKFAKSLLNYIDLIAVVPYFVELFIAVAAIYSGKTASSSSGPISKALRVVRVVRVFRIFKLTRHSKGLQILGRTFERSIRELWLLLLFLTIGLVLFSSVVYYAEQDVEDTQFKTIPHGFWWAIVTMTTVGYGDIVPRGIPGKIIGGACAISGLIAIALPVPVIVTNFNRIYLRERGRPQVEKVLIDALDLPDKEKQGFYLMS